MDNLFKLFMFKCCRNSKFFLKHILHDYCKIFLNLILLLLLLFFADCCVFLAHYYQTFFDLFQILLLRRKYRYLNSFMLPSRNHKCRGFHPTLARFYELYSSDKNHMSSIATMWLHRPRMSKWRVFVPVGNQFNTDLSSVYQVKMTKFKLKLWTAWKFPNSVKSVNVATDLRCTMIEKAALGVSFKEKHTVRYLKDPKRS